jgi:molybdopterin synthase sulfur carrier subunit
MARVFIPAQLVEVTGGEREVEVPGGTLREVIDALDARFPGFKARLVDGDRLRSGMNAAVDSVVHPTGLRQPVGETSEVHFIPAISGGAPGARRQDA